MSSLTKTNYLSNEIVKAADFTYGESASYDNIVEVFRGLIDEKEAAKNIVIYGFTVKQRSTPSMNVDIDAGLGLNASVGDLIHSDSQVGPVQIDDGGASDRIDTIQVRLIDSEYDVQQRAFKDPATEQVTYQDVPTKVRKDLEVQVLKGTGGSGVAPDATSGWVKIAEVFVAAGNNVSILDSNIRNITATEETQSNSSWTAEQTSVWKMGGITTLRSDYVSHTVTTSAGIHGSTTTATANRLIHRDAAGRAQVASPVASSDIATKGFIDGILAGAVTIGGKLTVSSGGADMTGDLTYTDDEFLIRPNTADASDTKGAVLLGGGTYGNSRGAYVAVYGNENSSFPGRLRLVGGTSGYVEVIRPTVMDSKLTVSSGGIEINNVGNATIDTTGSSLRITNTSNVAEGLILRNTGTINAESPRLFFLRNNETSGNAILRTGSGLVINVGASPGVSSGSTKFSLSDTGALLINDKLTVSSGGADMTGDLTYTDDEFLIRPNTADGSNTKGALLLGGGVYANDRGAYVAVYGNQNSKYPGRLRLVGGSFGYVEVITPTIMANKLTVSSGGADIIGNISMYDGTTNVDRTLTFASDASILWDESADTFLVNKKFTVSGTISMYGATNVDRTLEFASDARILWDESGDHFDFNKPIRLTGMPRIYAGDRVGILNDAAQAQGLNVGSLLVSDAYADASLVPANGAYIKGKIRGASGYNSGEFWGSSVSRSTIYDTLYPLAADTLSVSATVRNGDYLYIFSRVKRVSTSLYFYGHAINVVSGNFLVDGSLVISPAASGTWDIYMTW